MISSKKLPDIPVFVHGYDYPIPGGKGFLGLGQWLQYPMDETKVSRDTQQCVVNDLIDTFAEMIADAEQKRPSLHVVDVRETLPADQWANELHLTPKGFNKLSPQKFEFQTERLQ